MTHTANRTTVPVPGPAMKPTIIAARNDKAHITASAPPDGMKNSRTRNTSPKTSNKMAQVTGVIKKFQEPKDQEPNVSILRPWFFGSWFLPSRIDFPDHH